MKEKKCWNFSHVFYSTTSNDNRRGNIFGDSVRVLTLHTTAERREHLLQ